MKPTKKQLLGLGLIAVAGYLVYDYMQKNKKAVAPPATASTTAAPAAAAQSFSGDAGKRVKMTGVNGAVAAPKEKLFVGVNGWVGADAVPQNSGKFFAVKSSGF